MPSGPGMFQFDICGDGGELDALRRLVKDLSLQTAVTCHGYLDSPRLSAVFGIVACGYRPNDFPVRGRI